MNEPSCTTVYAVSVTSQTFSVIGSLTIIVMYYTQKRLQKFCFKLVMYLSISDIGTSMADLLMIFGFYKYPDQAGCIFQGMLMVYSILSSCFWTVIISWCLYNHTFYKNLRKEEDIINLERDFKVLAYGVPFVFALIPLITRDYGGVDCWCFIILDPESKNRFLALVLGCLYIPLWIAAFANITTVVFIYKKGKTAQIDEKDLKFIESLKYYPMVLVVCWTVPTIHRVLNFFVTLDDDTSNWISIIQVLTTGLMGFLNSLNFLTSKTVRLTIERIFRKKNNSHSSLDQSGVTNSLNGSKAKVVATSLSSFDCESQLIRVEGLINRI